MFNFLKNIGKKQEQNTPLEVSETPNQEPSIQFFDGISEQLSDVSLRVNQNTGVRNVLLTFNSLKSLTLTNTLTKQYSGSLMLIDTEGKIAVQPSSCKFLFGGDDGDDLKKVECTFEIDNEEHWSRFMRFMHRYAAANGMEYGEKNEP
jgi:photosystem II Psb28-2 protein